MLDGGRFAQGYEAYHVKLGVFRKTLHQTDPNST